MKVFEHNDVRLVITTQVEEIMSSHKQLKKKDKEAGGILLGQVTDKAYYLTRVSVPNIFDKRSRFTFERNLEIAQIIADYEFANSNGRTIYIGEWHTHPESYPTPSGRDKKMIQDQFEKGKNLRPILFLIIYGQKGVYASFYNGSKLIEMKEQEKGSL